jgi:hypothetical protein
MKAMKFVSTAIVSVLASFSPAYAARIYNELDTPIFVHGRGSIFTTEQRLVIEPGQRSKSLEWGGINTVNIFKGRDLNLGHQFVQWRLASSFTW